MARKSKNTVIAFEYEGYKVTVTKDDDGFSWEINKGRSFIEDSVGSSIEEVLSDIGWQLENPRDMKEWIAGKGDNYYHEPKDVVDGKEFSRLRVKNGHVEVSNGNATIRLDEARRLFEALQRYRKDKQERVEYSGVRATDTLRDRTWGVEATSDYIKPLKTLPDQYVRFGCTIVTWADIDRIGKEQGWTKKETKAKPTAKKPAAKKPVPKKPAKKVVR